MFNSFPVRRRRASTACAVILAVASAATLSSQTIKPHLIPIDGAMPAGAEADEMAVSRDQRHVYYSTPKGDLMFYDREHSTAIRIGGGDLWDVSLSADGSILCYTKTGEDDKGEFIFVIPLDPRTGAAVGPERRVSMLEGDTPAVSPDGKRIAFARDNTPGSTLPGQSIVVLPIAGGPETTIIPPLSSGIGSIRWTPDGSTLYFGVNPAPNSPGKYGTIQRVASTGGAPSIVVHAVTQSWPGLSPDGKLLVYGDTSASAGLTFADANGRRMGTLDLPDDRDAGSWIRGSTLLFTSSGHLREVKLYFRTDHSTRSLLAGVPRLYDPAWSADGKRIAVAHSSANRRELIIINPDGSDRRAYPMRYQAFQQAFYWSPDGKRIAYRGLMGTVAGLSVIELATGHEHVMTSANVSSQPRWTSDSRAVIVPEGPGGPNPATGSPPGARHFVMRRIGIDGRSTVAREVEVTGFAYASALDDQRLLLRGDSSGATVVWPLNGAGPTRVLLPRMQGFVSAYGLSPDRTLIAFRRNAAAENNRDMRVLEVIQLDNGHRTTVNLPFAAAPGEGMPQFLPGNDAVIIADTGSVYRLSLPGGAVTKLFAIPTERNRSPDFSVSPDGRTIMYVAVKAVPKLAFAADLASRSPR
jgi:Tol biopolymer transport system component